MSKEYDIIKIVDDNGNIFNLENIKKIHNNEYNKIVFPDGFVIDLKNAKAYYTSNDNANPSEALECLEKLKGMEISSMPFSDECGTQEVDLNDIRKVGSQLNTDFREYTTTIKQALQRLEAIDNSNPSEALEGLQRLDEREFHISEKVYVEELNDYVSETQYLSNTVAFSTIKQALIKAEQDKKKATAWNIVVSKNVDMLLIKKYDYVSDYNSAVWLSGREKLTEEEFKTIKEALEE